MTNRTREKIRFCSELCIDLLLVIVAATIVITVIGAAVVGLTRLGWWAFTGN